jgi:hypothetical protein
MKIDANDLWRRGGIFIFETTFSEATGGDGLNIRRND